MGYKYTVEEWDRIKKAREQEDRDTRIAYAEDMDKWSALREEQSETEIHAHNRNEAVCAR